MSLVVKPAAQNPIKRNILVVSGFGKQNVTTNKPKSKFLNNKII